MTTPAEGLPLDVVVVGHGMAGGRFVDEVLARTADGRARRAVRLTVVGAEPYGAYNRVLLSEVLAGRADVAALALSDPAALAARGVDIRVAVSATGIDLATGTVALDDGTRLPFDKVVLATGAEPVVPDVPGAGSEGLHTFRTVDDCREIVAAATNARRAVVVGGGLLGLETARGLARRGLEVTVLHAAGHVLERQLDAAAGAVLARTLRRTGIRLLVDASTTVVESRHGRVTGVRLADGRCVEADLVVVSIGVRARTALAVGAGLRVGRGVLVDDTLTTSDPRVLALGDCAEHDGVVGGLVAPAWAQARVAADRLTRADETARFVPQPLATRLKAADVEVASTGEVHVDPWCEDDGVEVVQLVDPSGGRYVKAVVRDGVVVGALAVGDPRAAADLALLVDRRGPAPVDRTHLLVGAAGAGAASTAQDPTLIPDRATVCRCNGVTKGAIVRAWSAGARTRQAVSAATRASTGCGTCAGAVEGILGWLAAADPDDPEPLAAAPGSVPLVTGGAR